MRFHMDCFMVVCTICTISVRATDDDQGLKASGGDYRFMDSLVEKLLTNYDRTIPPPPDPITNLGVNVTVEMWPYDITTVDIQRSAIKISGWIDMRWTDRNLVWSPEEYGNITEVFIQRNLLWLPEIDIFYSKSSKPPERKVCEKCPMRVTHIGNVIRGYYISYSFPCEINVKRFPYDEHICKIIIANWHMDDRHMDLWPEDITINRDLFLKNEEWDLADMNVTRVRDHYNYGFFPQLEYLLFIKRKPFTYVLNQVLPCISLTVTAIIGYHMPNSGNGQHGDKVKMGMTAILSVLILELAVANKLPKVSDVVPLIVVFYGAMMLLMTLAIMSTSAIIIVEKQGIYEKPVPTWVKRWFRIGERKVCPHSRDSTSAKSSPTILPNKVCKCCKPSEQRKLLTMLSRGKPANSKEVLDTQDTVTKAIVQSIKQLRKMFDKTREEMKQQRLVAEWKREWMMLADRLENLSLLMFLSGCAISVWLFFHSEEWYSAAPVPVVPEEIAT